MGSADGEPGRSYRTSGGLSPASACATTPPGSRARHPDRDATTANAFCIPMARNPRICRRQQSGNAREFRFRTRLCSGRHIDHTARPLPIRVAMIARFTPLECRAEGHTEPGYSRAAPPRVTRTPGLRWEDRAWCVRPDVRGSLRYRPTRSRSPTGSGPQKHSRRVPGDGDNPTDDRSVARNGSIAAQTASTTWPRARMMTDSTRSSMLGHTRHENGSRRPIDGQITRLSASPNTRRRKRREQGRRHHRRV